MERYLVLGIPEEGIWGTFDLYSIQTVLRSCVIASDLFENMIMKI